jgi:hypothetical protein
LKNVDVAKTPYLDLVLENGVDPSTLAMGKFDFEENWKYVTRTGLSVAPMSLIAGSSGQVAIHLFFKSDDDVPQGSRLEVTFPPGFQLPQKPTIVSTSGLQDKGKGRVIENKDVSTRGQTLVFTMRYNFSWAQQHVTIVVSDIQNPTDPGLTGTFTIATYRQNKWISQFLDPLVPGIIVTEATQVTPASRLPGETTSVQTESNTYCVVCCFIVC